MVLTVAAILMGLLLAGVIPATMPWTATIFGLVLFQWAFGRNGSTSRRE